MLGVVTGLALCWAVGAVLLYVPGQTELRHYAQDSAILSTLNQELPPEPPDRHARADRSVRHARRPGGGGRRRPTRPCSTRRASAAPRSASCASSAPPAGSASRARAGSRAPVSSSRTRTSSRASTSRASTATTATFSTPGSSRSTRSNDIAVLRVSGLDRPAASARRRRPGHARRRCSATRATARTPRPPCASGAIVQIVGRDAYGNFPTRRAVTTIRGVDPQRQLRAGRSSTRRGG